MYFDDYFEPPEGIENHCAYFVSLFQHSPNILNSFAVATATNRYLKFREL